MLLSSLSSVGAAIPAASAPPSNIQPAESKENPSSLRSTGRLPPLSVSASQEGGGGSDTYQKPRLSSHRFADMRSPVDAESVVRMASHMSTAIREYDEGRSLDALSFMSQLADLSADTSEFEGQQRIIDLPESVSADGYKPDFDDKLRGIDDGMTLRVETADGDLIDIKLETANGRNGERGLSFSFTVDGQLSDKERKALSDIGKELGRVANEFFKDGTAGLSQLAELGGDSLRGFSIELQSREYGELKLTHQIAAIDGTQRLQGEYQGYKFDISRQVGQVYVGGNVEQNPQYQSYLTVIEQATRDYDTDSEVTRFLKGGMDVIFGVQFEAEEVALPERKDRTYGQASSQLLNDFYSNLPDFSASFSSPVFVNEYNPSETAYMNLEMNQQTELSEKDSGGILAAQRFNYSQVVKTFEALPGMENPDLKGGNYIYQTLERSEELTRVLELKADRPVVALEARKGTESLTQKYKENHQLVDVKTENDQIDVVRDLLKEADRLGDKNAEKSLEKLLKSENLELFEFIKNWKMVEVE